MVIAPLVSLAATVVTGVIAYGEEGKGPLAGQVGLVAAAYADRDEAEHAAQPEGGAEGTESSIGELHGVLANITLALVVMHILGVVLASYVHRENFVLAMISGNKRRAQD